MKFPFVRQRDAMQCGVASLTMICRCFGADVDMRYVGQYCHASREGVSMLALSEAAEDLGLTNATLRLSADRLSEAPMPCILHWNQNHFVVLFKISSDGTKFHIADPQKGIRKYTRSELEANWLSCTDNGMRKGIAMFFEPDEDFAIRHERKSVDNASAIRFILSYMKKYRKFFVQILFGLLLGCMLQLIFPYLTQAIVDVGIKEQDIRFIWLVLLGELMIVIGSAVTDFVRRWLLLHMSVRINLSLLSDFIIKLLKLPMSYFETKTIGDMMQRMSDHGRIQSFLTGESLGVMFSLLSFIVFGIVLYIYNSLIFIVFMAGSLVYAMWTMLFLRRRRLLNYDLFDLQSKNQNKTYSIITSMQEIKLQDCEQRRRWDWEDTQADIFAVNMKSLKLQQTQEAGAIFINEVKNIITTVLAAAAVIDGNLSLGAMLAIQYILGQLNSPVMQLLGFIYSFQDVKISLERIIDVHAEEEENIGNRKIITLEDRKNASIRLRNIMFKYDPHSPKLILDDVDISIPGGKVTAIVGASGSGKTTLLKLILGYYEPLSGKISVNGELLSEIDLKWWRRCCGVVMQDGIIFPDSIARNIAPNDGEIDLDRMYEAARVANIHDFAKSLPLGYDTIIGNNGIGISLGQKQRILIARAVYRNPEFILLDEATNSLDAKNESEIVENLRKFYRGRTVLIIAHRLSTVKEADNIIVLEHGRVVESGDHKSLSSLRGVYYELVKNQLELGN